MNTPDPRAGKLSREEAFAMREIAEISGIADSMPAWMKAEIDAKTQPVSPDLHAAILNLPNNDLYDWGKCNARLTYQDGYERAQNDAAALVLPLVERCKELEEALHRLRRELVAHNCGGWRGCLCKEACDIQDEVDAGKPERLLVAKIEKGEQ